MIHQIVSFSFASLRLGVIDTVSARDFCDLSLCTGKTYYAWVKVTKIGFELINCIAFGVDCDKDRFDFLLHLRLQLVHRIRHHLKPGWANVRTEGIPKIDKTI